MKLYQGEQGELLSLSCLYFIVVPLANESRGLIEILPIREAIRRRTTPQRYVTNNSSEPQMWKKIK